MSGVVKYTPTRKPGLYRHIIRNMGAVIVWRGQGKTHAEIADWMNEQGFLREQEDDTTWDADQIKGLCERLGIEDDD